jgi:hypothetical protein
MNLLLSYSGAGKVLQSSTFQDAINLAETLSEPRYFITEVLQTLVVNDTNGICYTVTLVDDSTTTNYMIFDSSSSNVLTWILNNHPSSVISSFQKSINTLHI